MSLARSAARCTAFSRATLRVPALHHIWLTTISADLLMLLEVLHSRPCCSNSDEHVSMLLAPCSMCRLSLSYMHDCMELYVCIACYCIPCKSQTWSCYVGGMAGRGSMLAMQVPRLRAKTATLLFREQFETLVKDTKSALDVIATAVQQVSAGQTAVCTQQLR